MSILSKPYFHDEAAAYAHLESILWPEGPSCPHCGNVGKFYELNGVRSKPSKKNPEGVVRYGLRKCAECRKQFTVTVKTVFESAHLPLHKMLQAVYLMCASKKGISAHQLHRILECQYKTAWFLCHRIREAMRDGSINPGMLGGANKAVEADETYVGGKAKNRAFREPSPKKPVLSLVEREGQVRSFHVANVTAKTVGEIVAQNVDKASALMTDESVVYPSVAKRTEMASHYTVNHSANEYVRLGSYVHINTAENYYSILKRGIMGTFHSVSEAHLHRYLAEFDFRYNNRVGLGVDDKARTVRALKGVVGKRLKYQGPSAAV